MNPWTDKRWKVIAWGATVIIGLGIVFVALRLLLGKRGPVATGGAITRAVNKARDNIAVANAKAAVEMSDAHAKEQSVKAEMASIAADDDEERRLARLINLRQRVQKP